MKRATLFLLCGAVIALPIQLSAQTAAGAKPAAPAAASAKGRVVEIEVAAGAMKFSVPTIQAKPGEDLVVRLKVLGTMPKGTMDHNFVLLKEGANAATFANDAMMAGATGYIPAARKGDVLAMSPLGSGGQTVEAAFKAPTKAGTYTFICTFPGHFAAGMRGTLVVK